MKSPSASQRVSTLFTNRVLGSGISVGHHPLHPITIYLSAFSYSYKCSYQTPPFLNTWEVGSRLGDPRVPNSDIFGLTLAIRFEKSDIVPA